MSDNIFIPEYIITFMRGDNSKMAYYSFLLIHHDVSQQGIILESSDIIMSMNVNFIIKILVITTLSTYILAHNN